MLNEERIKLMTKMAAYEENEGRHNAAIGSYFRGDYISLQILGSAISATLAFLIALAVMIFYHFETVMKEIYQVDLPGMGKKLLLYYVIYMGIYMLISLLVYAYRYNRARKSLKKYYSHLEELSYLYETDKR